MASLAQLQMNPLFLARQAATELATNQQGLQSLIQNPLHFLQQTPVVCAVGTGHLTAQNAMTGVAFNANDELLIGANAQAFLYPNRTTVSALETATRSSTGAGLVNRLAATPRFAVGIGAQLWITDQQTGCTVLALDWGGNQYSLFHLFPYQNADFSIWARAAFSMNKTVRAEIKNASLRSEATQVVNASLAGGAQPQRYILLQSMHNITAQRRMQTIGVQRNGGWEFYRQIQEGLVGNLTVHAAELAPWRPWNEYFYHDL